MFRALAITTLTLGMTTSCLAGGELPVTERPAQPSVSVPTGARVTIPKPALAPPAGWRTICREWPLPAPSRNVGDGQDCHEFYGPTYYYAFTNNTYEGTNPKYYPFFHERRWPNYKTPGSYSPGIWSGTVSRSARYWDNYDDWSRGGRYEQRQ